MEKIKFFKNVLSFDGLRKIEREFEDWQVYFKKDTLLIKEKKMCVSDNEVLLMVTYEKKEIQEENEEVKKKDGWVEIK